ncbi:MAG TPA: ammonia channel protein [Planctomycetes bacterium]|nr:ammonia channel protein [Planctomycetota bacterium]
MLRTLLTLLAAIALSVGVGFAEETPPAAAAPAPAAEAPAPEPELPAITGSAEAKQAAGAGWFGTYTPAIKVEEGKPDKLDPAASIINNGDNAWMLTSTLLVLMMTIPGLALFYGGLVRRKNVLSTMMHSFSLAGFVTVIWTVFGFAIAFGGAGPYWGGFSEFVMLKDVFFSPALAEHTNRFPINLDYAPTISFGVFCMFQLMFAIITPALISGAYAERVKFSAMLIFTGIWLVLCYLPLAHMVWGKNGLFNWGFGANDWAAFDFAGGTVVHISSGIAALVFALFLGKRKGYPETQMAPHSLVLSVIGAALLWVGWFGFNAGSALGANGLAALAFGNTMIATAAAALSWPLAEWIIRGKPTVLGAISGAVAGLVAITPACGFVEPGSALVIGLIAGALCFSAVTYLKRALGYDDALDAFGIHGIGGIFGAIATGIFFSVDVNPNIPALNKDLYMELIAGQQPVVWNQIKAVLVTVALSAVVSTVALLVAKFTVGLRPSGEDESAGLDLSQHGEEGYNA